VQRSIALVVLTLVSACAPPAIRSTGGPDTAATRKELESWYQQNTQAYLAHDFAAIMALRAPDFHSITPDGVTQDRGAMERYIEGFLNGVKKWNRVSFTLDSVRVAGDTASAIVSQYLDRMALRPTTPLTTLRRVTQRETDSLWRPMAHVARGPAQESASRR
jgi:ketosteroid isomerase-like protein